MFVYQLQSVVKLTVNIICGYIFSMGYPHWDGNPKPWWCKCHVEPMQEHEWRQRGIYQDVSPFVRLRYMGMPIQRKRRRHFKRPEGEAKTRQQEDSFLSRSGDPTNREQAEGFEELLSGQHKGRISQVTGRIYTFHFEHWGPSVGNGPCKRG